MFPKLPSEASFVKLCYPYSEFIRRHMLCNYVHRYLAQKQIGTDTGGCGNSRFLHNLPDHLHRKIMCGYLINAQIMGHIHEHLVYGINMHILRGNIFHIYTDYPGAGLHIMLHPRRSYDIPEL